MAALYLHNAIFIPEVSAHESQPHSRTLSSGTFRTVNSDSHPTEPLLNSYPDYSTLAFQDLLTRQPTHPDRPNSPQDVRLSLQGLPPTKEDHWEVSQNQLRRRLRLLKGCIVALQVIMAIWAAYNVIRYYIAMSVYSTHSGPILAVSLGTACLVALVYLACANLAHTFQDFLVKRNIPLHYVRAAEALFRWLASFLFLSPAIINFVLVFLFKTNENFELEVLSRCDLESDLIWSVTRHRCSHPDKQITWAAWVGIATVRLVLTTVLVVFLHSALYSHHFLLRHPDIEPFTERPLPRKRRTRFRPTHTHSSSTAWLNSPNSPPVSMISAHSYNTPLHPGSQPGSVHLSSIRSSSSPFPIPRSPSDPGLRQSPPLCHSPQPPSSNTFPRLSQSSSGTPPPSLDQYFTEADVERIVPSRLKSRSQPPSDPLQPESSGASSRPAPSDEPSDLDVDQRVDQFHSLVSQISREAEEAIEFAQPDSEFNPYFNRSHEMGPQLPSAVLGSDEFGRPYPAEERVSILNTYVRKMPTIESIGSRELGSMKSMKSAEWERERMASIHTLSRPPTRLTMSTTDYGCVINGGYGGSNPPSRSSSLNFASPSSPSVEIGPGSEPPWFSNLGSSLKDSPPSPGPITPPAVALVRREGSISTNHSSGSHSAAFSHETEDSSRSFHTPSSGCFSPTLPNHPYRTASPVHM